MKQKDNKLRVKYSNFQTDMTFNQWTETFKVSSLVPEQFEQWDKKLDKCNEHEKRMMISSLYDNDVSEPISKKILSSIKQLLNKKECLEKTN
jgi:hypothetical protein